MGKTIVNIITEDNPLSAYLFIKEMYEEGDSLMYISAKETEDDLDLLSEIDGIDSKFIEEILLKNDMDEISYERICRAVKSHLKRDVHYCVNLAGGTRYMALAVQQVFEDFNSDFYYTDVEENVIIKSKFDDNIDNGDDYYFPIKHRMGIEEYLKVHEIKCNIHKKHIPIRSEEASLGMFELFSQELLSGRDWEILEILRNEYRGQKIVYIRDIESDSIPDLYNFFNRMNFSPSSSEVLTKAELDYLTGGWFEEYIYYLLQKTIEPQDIALGLIIHQDNVQRQNELDVIFTKGNKLFVIECKSGIQNTSMFNEIIYKSCALKEALLGVSCCSYVFSLKKDKNDMLQRIAQNMDIDFVDYDILVNQDELEKKILEMKKISKD